MIEFETVGKLADATKAVADVGNTAIVTAQSLGSVIRGPLDQIVGIVCDRLQFWRWQGQLTLGDKAAAIMRKRGLVAPTRDLPINFAVPLLTSALTEEDDELQEAWARLLVNAGDAATEMELRTAYVEILRGMSGFDVLNLSKLAEAALSLPHTDFGYVATKNPSLFDNWYEGGSENTPLRKEVAISLANLSRLGCILPSSGFGGSATFSHILVTELGIAMYRACS
jgi:hypothetical protein